MVSQLNFCLGKLGAILQSWQIALRGRIVLKWEVTIQLIKPPPPPPKETKFYWRWGGGGEQRDYLGKSAKRPNIFDQDCTSEHFSVRCLACSRRSVCWGAAQKNPRIPDLFL